MTLAARNSDASLRQLPLIGVALVIIFAFWSPIVPLLAWWVVMTGTAMLQRRVLRPYLAGTIRASDLHAASWRFALGNAAQMIIYCSIAPIAWVNGEVMQQALLLLILGVTMSSVSSITGPSRLVFVSDLLPPAITAVFVPLIMSGWSGAPLAFSSMLFALLMLDNAQGAYRLAENALTLNDENEALIRQLRAADRAKSAFLANMSHELRTPLNAILGFSEVMKDEVLGAHSVSRYRAYSHDIHSSGSHLLSLIEDILDHAKLEAGRFEPRDERVSLAEIVEACLLILERPALAGQLRLNAAIDGDIVLNADARALKQIVLNLMSNAVKFTQPRGDVTVGADRNEIGRVRLWVKDSGIGIHLDDQARIFESFGQGRHDVAVKDKGTGLGLAIVRGLVDAHGGEIAVESVLEQGTTMTVTLPAHRVIDVVPGSAVARAA